MTKPTVRIHNTETDEVIDREMTDAEYVIYQQEQAFAKEMKANYAKAVADKEAAQGKLEALGLSIDDLKALGL
jgi:hypothetical protein